MEAGIDDHGGRLLVLVSPFAKMIINDKRLNARTYAPLLWQTTLTMSNQCVTGPLIDRSVTLHCVGDWGQANFHRILSWLCQEFCDRAGPKSRTGILSLRDGGLVSVLQVYNGEADLGTSTPAALLKASLRGEEISQKTGPLPSLRALAVLPLRDRLMFAAAMGLNISSFAEIRDRKLPLRIAVSENDGTNLIGYISAQVWKPVDWTKRLCTHGVALGSRHAVLTKSFICFKPGRLMQSSKKLS